MINFGLIGGSWGLIMIQVHRVNQLLRGTMVAGRVRTGFRLTRVIRYKGGHFEVIRLLVMLKGIQGHLFFYFSIFLPNVIVFMGGASIPDLVCQGIFSIEWARSGAPVLYVYRGWRRGRDGRDFWDLWGYSHARAQRLRRRIVESRSYQISYLVYF